MSRRYLAAKRAIDVFVSAAMLIVTAPVGLIIATAIRITMGKPVLFRQQRLGKEGHPFTILKFRTMIPAAEEVGGGYVPAGSNLITPLGQALRRTSLDELPQLMNILRGDMSLVGPRPALVDHLNKYDHRQVRRLDVRPGVTGLAQITLRNSALWSARIERDLEYVERASLRMDVLLILRTIPAILSGSGMRSDQVAADVDDLGAAP